MKVTHFQKSRFDYFPKNPHRRVVGTASRFPSCKTEFATKPTFTWHAHLKQNDNSKTLTTAQQACRIKNHITKHIFILKKHFSDWDFIARLIRFSRQKPLPQCVRAEGVSSSSKKHFSDWDPSCASLRLAIAPILSLAIVLTLAPFYPTGNTKTSQKWLLSTVKVLSIKKKFVATNLWVLLGGVNLGWGNIG